MIPIAAFSHALVDRVSALSPTLATFAGISGYDHRWDDFGPAGVLARAALWEGAEAELAAKPVDPEDADGQLAARVLSQAIRERREFYSSEDPWLDLNNIVSPAQLIPMAFDAVDLEGTGRESALCRLEALPAAIDSYRALLNEGLRLGRVVAARQVESVIRQGRAQTGERSLYQTLARRLSGTPAHEAARCTASGEAADRAVSSFTDWLQSHYLPSARREDGVGRVAYLRAARRHLGATLDPEEASAWAWSEIGRIEADARRVAQEILPDASLSEVVVHLSADPDASLPIPAFEAAIRHIQAEALSSLDGKHFDVPAPARAMDVRFAQPGGKVGAYYLGPSEDFSRPGTLWYSPGTRDRLPLWSEVTTAYHEGFPGHHLQVSTALYLRDRLSRYQRLFGDCTAYTEGWALYAEQLMFELGFVRDPGPVLGLRLGQLARAWRVVVDIGLHLGLRIPVDSDFHPGEIWSYDIAVEAMRDRALLQAEVAESEVVRYLGWPGQAICYALGRRELMSLRAERQRREGAAFELRRLHAEVLGAGSVGMETLRGLLLGGGAIVDCAAFTGDPPASTVAER